ncbi:DUF6266 family protein [Pedobacter nyackensis]|uniref:Uncharacterized protein n=1 Tax=Pedobacter nyackensis TaxID=475255 RepID=A0A1W2EYC9_9SPHI|nr:DUF6266 family protein [Pedobacter nyackensis]SMD14208.1 hypothetical protein SAMN04488101_11741 [Pedobacter nyackensis]
MARLKNGILGPLIGKIANLVGYVRLGQPVIRMEARKRKKKRVRSDAQKAVNLRFKIVKSFIAVISGFINVGYKLDVAGTTKIPENNAVSYHINEAVTGTYPDLVLDYSKVLISRGKLSGPLNPTVELEGDVLKFKWDVDPKSDWKRKRDQVMLLAYKTATHESDYIVSGARRFEGEDELRVQIARHKNRKDDFLETYMAFISDDRQSISNSVYVGRVAV